jgi:hypothetical protein
MIVSKDRVSGRNLISIKLKFGIIPTTARLDVNVPSRKIW